MSTKINFLFVPYHNVGGHFIDWSIQFVCDNLSNPTDVSNFTNKNWHNCHKSIETKGFEKTLEIVNNIQNNGIGKSKFENIYVSLLSVNDASKKLFNCDFENTTIDQRIHVDELVVEDTKKMIEWAFQEKFIPVMFDYYDSDLHSMFYNDRCVLDWNDVHHNSITDKINLYINTFFSSNKDRFNSTIWDFREMVALTYCFPKKTIDFDSLHNSKLPHLYYNTDDIWHNFLPVLIEICNTLELEINNQKIPEWIDIYNKWRTVHDPYFGRHLNRIVDAIVQNKYLSLERFDLNFYKEALIQHILIKDYNLNIKTWQLEKFPTNTQDLHKLLEPNIHV